MSDEGVLRRSLREGCWAPSPSSDGGVLLGSLVWWRYLREPQGGTPEVRELGSPARCIVVEEMVERRWLF